MNPDDSTVSLLVADSCCSWDKPVSVRAELVFVDGGGMTALASSEASTIIFRPGGGAILIGVANDDEPSSSSCSPCWGVCFLRFGSTVT